jgi:hypothetical protein
MTATLEKIDRWQAAPADVDVLARMVEAADRRAATVDVACSDVRRDDDELVIELEVRLPLIEPEMHPIPGFHADVTGC